MKPMRCPNCGQQAEVLDNPPWERYYKVLVRHQNPICPYGVMSYHHTHREAIKMFNKLMEKKTR